jgi:hypothetical protein
MNTFISEDMPTPITHNEDSYYQEGISLLSSDATLIFKTSTVLEEIDAFNTAVTQVINEAASKERHDQRRSNLRKKRANEQFMQVVDGFIREHTVMATVQAYVEANFLNDMMNTVNDVITTVIEGEMRRTIQGVLREIYFAHIASLFLENLMIDEIKKIVYCATAHAKP